MDSINLTPGIYYQDILADGTRSIIRSKWPTLQRVSYDTKAAVVQTLKITVEDLHADQLAMQERLSENRPSLRISEDMIRSRETIDISAIKKIRHRKPEVKIIDHNQALTPDDLKPAEREALARGEAELLFKK